MSPPSEESLLAGLADLAGEALPAQSSLIDPLDQALVKIKLVTIAKGNGATWGQIAPWLGVRDAKAAKWRFRNLARDTQAALIRRDAQVREAG